MISGLTISLREDSYHNFDNMNEYVTNLVPFPRLKFLISSMSPLIPSGNNIEMHEKLVSGYIHNIYDENGMQSHSIYANYHYTYISSLIYDIYQLHFLNMKPYKYEENQKSAKSDLSEIQNMCDLLFNGKYFLCDFKGFDASDEQYSYVAISLAFRGKHRGNKEINAVAQWVKGTQRVGFVEWSPTGFKINKNEIGCFQSENDPLLSTELNAFAICNNCYFGEYFYERVTDRFSISLKAKKGLIQSYLNDGMEQNDFEEALEDMQFLKQDYQSLFYDSEEESEGES